MQIIMPNLAGFLHSTGGQAASDQTPLLKSAPAAGPAGRATHAQANAESHGEQSTASRQDAPSKPPSSEPQYRPDSVILSELSMAQSSLGIRASAAAKSVIVHFVVGTLFGVLFADPDAFGNLCGEIVIGGSSSPGSASDSTSDDANSGATNSGSLNGCLSFSSAVGLVLFMPIMRLVFWIGLHRNPRVRNLARRFAGTALCCTVFVVGGFQMVGAAFIGPWITAVILAYCQGAMVVEILQHPSRSQLPNIAARLAGAAVVSGAGLPALILQLAAAGILGIIVVLRLKRKLLVFHPSRVGGTSRPHVHTTFGDGRLTGCQQKLHMAGALLAWFGAASQVASLDGGGVSRSFAWAMGLAVAAGLAGLSAALMNRARARAKKLILLLAIGLVVLAGVLHFGAVHIPRLNFGVIAAGAFIGSLLEWRLIQSPPADVSDWFWCVALCPMSYVVSYAALPSGASEVGLVGLFAVMPPALLLLQAPNRDSSMDLATRSAYRVDPCFQRLVELAKSKDRMAAPLSKAL